MSVSNELCRRSVEYISRDLDGDLAEFERAMLRAHVAWCEPCRGVQERMTEQTAALRSAVLEPIPRPIALPSTRRFPAFRFTAPAAAAAVAVAGLVTFGVVGRGSEQAVSGRALSSVSVDLKDKILLERHLRALKGTEPTRPHAPSPMRPMFIPF